MAEPASYVPLGRPVALSHKDDLSRCESATVKNEHGTLICVEHGRPVWGAGWLVPPDAVSWRGWSR
jgi:hypothetical protein